MPEQIVATNKSVIYAPIPTFDQSTQYVVQLEPVEMVDHIFVGVEIKKLENLGSEYSMLRMTQGE